MSKPIPFFDNLKVALAASADALPSQPFIGDQRNRVLHLLTESLQNGRQTEVMQVLARDWTMAQESALSPWNGGLKTPLPILILEAGLLAPFLLCVARGFDINTQHPDKAGWSWALQSAVHLDSTANASFLLSLGASPNGINAHKSTSQNLMLYKAVTKWVTGFESAGVPSIAHLLLDAGATIDPGDDSGYFHALILRGDWSKPEYRTEATKLMVRLQKAGGDINAKGDQLQSPLFYAIGRKNGHAAEALVLLGAEVSTSREKDIVELLLTNGLEDFVPRIQAHLMNRTIKNSAAKAAQGGTPSLGVTTPTSSHRRVNAGI